MKRYLLLGLIATVVVLCSFALTSDALSFNSYFPKVHDQITDDALKGLQQPDGTPYFTDKALARVKKAARNQDWSETGWTLKPNDKYRASHHFDRNASAGNDQGVATNSQQPFKDGATYVKEQRTLFINKMKETPPKTDEALDALGRALHALEDLYSHSNFVDLAAADKAQVRKAFDNPAAQNPPADLKLTYYPDFNQEDVGTDPQKGGDAYHHETFNKDKAKASADAKITEKDAGKDFDGDGKISDTTTKFDAAKKAATEHKKEFVEALKTDLTPQKWQPIEEYVAITPSEIPHHTYALYFVVVDSATGQGIPYTSLDIYLPDSTKLASWTAHYDGTVGWYLPEGLYSYTAHAVGYYPFSSPDITLSSDRTEVVYLASTGRGGIAEALGDSPDAPASGAERSSPSSPPYAAIAGAAAAVVAIAAGGWYARTRWLR